MTTRKPASTRKPRAKNALADREMARYCDQWVKEGATPQKLDVLRRLIVQAWEIVCYMTEAGLTFRSSSPEQAALTIAGSAYAGWRGSGHDNPDADSNGPVEIVEGFATGILWAMWMGNGMPSELADSYAWIAGRSESVVDRMIPLQVVERLFPEMVKGGRLTLARVGVEPVDPGAWDACMWSYRPNILTASVEEVRDEARRDRARRKKAAAKKRSKAKPRAK